MTNKAIEETNRKCALHPKYDATTCRVCLKALKWTRDLISGSGDYAKKPILKPWEEGR